MDSIEIWFAAGGLAFTVFGGVVTYAIGYGKLTSMIDGLASDLEDLNKVPDRVLVLETQQRYQADSMDEIKQSLAKLASEVRESNHKIREDLQKTSNSLVKMDGHLEAIKDFINDQKQAD